jgi:hypothetical protein
MLVSIASSKVCPQNGQLTLSGTSMAVDGAVNVVSPVV